MKLEAGQKIGIYEALTEGEYVRHSFIIGNNYLGVKRPNGVYLFNGYYHQAMYNQEVHLVASLRVKAVK